LLQDGTEVTLRPLVEEDEFRLLDFFRRTPQGERYYLKENVASPEVIQHWTSNLDYRRVIPIIALAAAGSVGFREVAVLKEWVRDIMGEYQDLVIMEMPLENHRLSSWF
jgi:hypothetical protein